MGDRPSEGDEYPMRLQCVCAFGSSAPSTGVLTAGLRGGVAAGPGRRGRGQPGTGRWGPQAEVWACCIKAAHGPAGAWRVEVAKTEDDISDFSRSSTQGPHLHT